VTSNTDQAGRKTLEELQHLATPQLTAQDSAALGINAVQLENRFHQIDPEYANLVHGWLPSLAVSQHPTWHIAMPEAGAIHSINGASMTHPLPACVSSGAFLDPPSGSKAYFRKDHFSGGRPPASPATPTLAPRPVMHKD
jgi:hypothetical protein